MAKTFGAQSTTEDVLEGVNLSGKRILVTGGSAGLGVETVRVLSSHGAIVVAAARDLAKAKTALDAAFVDAKKGGGGIELVDLDLASLKSVRKAADTILASNKPLDVIIDNAGVMACPFSKTEDGFERQFGTNHLGHFVLVNRLAPLLKSGARVVSVASAGHRLSDINLDDPNFERTAYTPFTAYGRAKTANVLFAVGLDKRLKGRGVRATALHPGAIATELGRYMTDEAKNELKGFTQARLGGRIEYKSVPQGAATSVWCAIVAPADEIGGKYCEDCQVAALTEDPNAMFGVRAYALDPKNADALWAKSEEMVSEKFTYG